MRFPSAITHKIGFATAIALGCLIAGCEDVYLIAHFVALIGILAMASPFEPQRVHFR
ncbi:MAG: hypothetical protein J6R09_00650 [Alistipes sp.]|nr:hypothetical protein [Alistipes sp.]